MPLKRNYTMSEVHELITASEGRRPKAKEDGGHTVKLHADGRTGTVADGRKETAIVLADTLEKTRKMDPSEGFIALSSDEKDVDARFTSRLDLIKAVTAALNSPVGQTALEKVQTGKPRATFVAPLTPAISNIERYTKATGSLERGLRATSVFVKINRLGNGKTAKLHLQTAYPKDVG